MVLLVVAAYSPLEVAAVNFIGIVHPERLGMVVAIGWLIGLAILFALRRIGLGRPQALLTAVVSLLCLTRGSVFVVRFGPLSGYLIAILVVIAVGMLAHQVDNTVIAKGLLWAVVAFIVGGWGAKSLESLATLGEDEIPQQSAVEFRAAATPDVFLIVLDGHAGARTSLEDYGPAAAAWVEELETRGFQIPRASLSSYPTTAASLPSLLDMSFPMEEGSRISVNTLARLGRVTGGENELFDALSAHGYTTTMVEAGWSGSNCGSNVEVCVGSPFLDAATFMALQTSIFGNKLTDTYGSSLTQGSLGTMRWLASNVAAISDNGTPDLVFAHVMAPHIPFFLDAECNVEYSPGRATFTQAEAEPLGSSPYEEQAACVDGFIVDLADAIPPDAIVVFVSDHGTDSRHQLRRLPAEWSYDDIRERFDALVAVRAGDCEIGDALVIPNLMRRVLSCIAEDPILDLEDRLYVYAPSSIKGESSPVVRVSSTTVYRLMQGA